MLEKKDGSIHFNSKWFENPIDYINKIPTEHADEIVELLQGLMGGSSGNTLGTTVVESENETTRRRWHPLPAAKKSDPAEAADPSLDSTGLYIVSEQDQEDKNKLTLALGLLKSFAEDSVEFTPYVYLPLVHMPPAAGQTVFSSAPVEMGMTLTKADGFGEAADPVSFDGLKISTHLYLTPAPGGETDSDRKKPLEIVLLNLKLPGQQAANVSVVDLIQKTIQKDAATINEWITIGVALLTSQLAKAIDAAGGTATARQIANMTVDLLSLLGITGQTPAIDWQKVFEPQPDFKKIITDWFIQIAASPYSMKAWLNELFSLFKGELAAARAVDDHVRGAGTRAEPWVIEMLNVEDSLTLDLTFAVEKAPDHPLDVYPGLRIASNVFKPIKDVAQLGVCLQASVELCRMAFNRGAASQPPDATRTSAIADAIFPTFEVLIKALNPQPDQPLIAIGTAEGLHPEKAEGSAEAFRLDTIEIGFGYGRIKPAKDPAKAGRPEEDRVLAPNFRLTNVQTAIGAWPVIDFHNFDGVIKVLGQAVSSVIKTTIEDYLGKQSSPYAASLLIALGINPPEGYGQQAPWPIEAFLQSAASLDLVVKNPLAALGSYYTRALTTPISKGPKDPVYAWQAMLPDIVRLVSGLSIAAADVQGTGSAGDPWLAPLITTDRQKPNVFLQTWIDPCASTARKPQLHLGLKIDVPIILNGVRIDAGGELDFLKLQLPDENGSGQIGAQWLPRVAGYIEVRNPSDNKALATPKIAGVSLEADKGSLACGWDRAHGLFFSAKMLAIAVAAAGTDKLEIGDLIFELDRKNTPWSGENLTAFAKVVVYIAGLCLLEQGGRFGLLTAATLGLLPNLPEIINADPDPDLPFEVPRGVALPENFPQLDISDPATFFARPWTDLKNHLAALFASPANVGPLLQIWGWAMTGKVPVVPQPFPGGSLRDPWSVKFENLRDAQLLIWVEKADGHDALPAAIGVGLQRTMAAATASDIQLEVVAALKAFHIPLNAGHFESKNTIPACSVAAHLTNRAAATPLFKEDQLNLEIERVELGLQADLSSPEAEGLMAPLLVFKNAKANGRDPEYFCLQPVAAKPIFTSSGRMPDLEKLLNALMHKLSGTLLQSAPDSRRLRDVLLLLQDMGLVQGTEASKSAAGPAQFSINPAAWQALLANPGAYLRSRMDRALNDAEKSAGLFRHLRSILGLENFKLPSALNGLPAVLVALDLMRPAGAGYGILLSSWLSLIKAPLLFMENRAARLLKDADRRQQLMTELSHLPAAPLNVPLSLRLIAGARIQIATSAAAPIRIGSELTLVADVDFDLENLILQVQGGIAVSAIGTALVFRDTVTLKPDLRVVNTLQVLLQAAPDVAPAPFDPLVFYPLPDQGAIDSFLTDLGQRVPLQVLSYIAGKYINRYVLTEKHSIASRLLVDMGLARQIGNPDQPPQVTALTRALKNPVQWFLSPEVIGQAGGGLDLDKVGQLLSDLPGPAGTTGPADILISPRNKSGLKIANLPFGLSVELAADQAGGIQLGVAVDYPAQSAAGSTAAPAASPALDDIAFNTNAGLAFGLGAGVKVHGGVGLKYKLSQAGTFIKLAAGYQKDQFSFDIQGSLNGKESKTIQLVPFGGFNQFIPSAAEGGKLLDYIAGKISMAYHDCKHQADPELVKLVEEVFSVARIFKIEKAGDIITAVESIVHDPLTWLSEPFGATKIEDTLQKINQLFTLADLKGFKQEGTLLRYSPGIKSDLGSVSILFGMQTFGSPADKKEVFGIWLQPCLKKSWLVLDITAGVGAVLPFADSGLDFTLTTVLGTDFSGLDVPLTAGPQLDFGLDFAIKTGAQPPTIVPSLRLLPIGDQDQAPVVSLLPNLYLAFNHQPEDPVAVVEWLLRFSVQFLIPLAVDTVLQIPAVNQLLSKPLITGQDVSFGKIFNNCRLIKIDKVDNKAQRYVLNDIIATYGKMTILDVIATFAYGALSSFVESKGSLPIIKFSHGSINLVGAEAADNTLDYGLNVQISDIALTGQSSPNQQDNQNPNGGSVELLLQLGKWLQYEKGVQTWLNRSYPDWPGSQPGMNFYLVNASGADDIHFKPRLELASIGLDIKGQNQAPLVNFNGFRLGALEPRLYFAMGIDLKKSGIENLKFGGAMRADGLGIPMGPGFGKIADDKAGQPNNPVAQNLLASNSAEPGGGKTEGQANTNAVNPTFSMALGYVSSEKFDLTLYDDKKPDEPTTMITLPVQREFGPVQVRKLGIGWESKKKLAKFLFDGGVGLLGLHADLIDLTIGVPVTHPGDFGRYTLDLAGLDISFEGGPVAISGGFLKTQPAGQPYPEYAGLGIISAAGFGLTAIGAYGTMQTADGKLQPSLMIFAMLGAPLGGVPAFFVTGVAAGFGINRAFIPPPIDAVEKFPLIAGIADPGQLGGGEINKVLEKLHENLPARLGVYWLAAGLRFTSFELIQGLALAVVAFGKEFEVALLGLASIQLPKKGVGGKTPYVYAELGIRVLFAPQQGVFAASAVLTPNSHLIDPNCRLTGGFAFYIWYAPHPKAGEFVLSIGGYGPVYPTPDYYPKLDPVGFNWHVSSTVVIKGGAYFALTPRAIMAGGRLEALFHTGGLRAWFTAHADFFISWKPFHYYIAVGINVGVSYTFKAIVTVTLKVELGVEVEIWGPRFSGRARVNWFIISFSIPFGSGDASKQPAKAIDWNSFDRYFLPQPSANATAGRSEVCRSAILKGLAKSIYVKPDNTLSDQPADDTLTLWIVRADEMVLSSQTIIPATQIQFISQKNKSKAPILAGKDQTVGIRPMAAGEIISSHIISIQMLSENGQEENGAIDISTWQAAESRSAVPAALWDTGADVNTQPKEASLPNRLVGLAWLRPAVPDIGRPIEVDIAHHMSYQERSHRILPLQMSTSTNRPPAASKTSLQTIEATVMRAEVVKNRQSVLQAIIAGGINVQTNGRLDILAANAQHAYAGSPLLGSLAAADRAAQADAGRRRPARRQARAEMKMPAPARPPRLKAVMRRYASPYKPEFLARAGAGLRADPADQFNVPFYSHGKVYGHHPLARFQNGKVVRRAAAPAGADTRSSRQQMTVEVGKSLVWEIDSRNPTPHTLKLDRKIPVRVTAFNAHGSLLADQVVAEPGYQLPQDTAQVILTGLAAGADSNTVGWHADALLVQANPVAMLGEGVIIRPQAPHAAAHGRYRAAFGLKAARALIRDNTIETLDGSQTQGWITTLMPAAIGTLVLCLRRADRAAIDPAAAADRCNLQLSWVRPGRTQTESVTLQDSQKIESNSISDEVFITYRVPPALLEGADVMLRVFVSTQTGWLQTGLFGLRNQAKRAPGRVNLPDHGHAKAETLDQVSTVEIG